MKVRPGMSVAHAATAVLEGGPADPLEFASAPRNRRERRARAAQERIIRRAYARGREPHITFRIG